MSETHRFRSMGCDAVVAGGDPATVVQVLSRWEATFSLFSDDSELSRVNSSSQHVLVVSQLFANALETALDAAAQTEGLVDPTLGRGLEEVRLAGRVLMRPPGLTLDLNCVVKALAVDEAAQTLEGDGFVSVGGDLAVRGPVDVALPGGGSVRVVSGGLATSGIASRGSHLVDVTTGLPSDSPWKEVTASGATCLLADVAAKAGFLLGERGPDWLEEHGVPARFLSRDDLIVENGAWTRAMQEAPACI